MIYFNKFGILFFQNLKYSAKSHSPRVGLHKLFEPINPHPARTSLYQITPISTTDPGGKRHKIAGIFPRNFCYTQFFKPLPVSLVGLLPWNVIFYKKKHPNIPIPKSILNQVPDFSIAVTQVSPSYLPHYFFPENKYYVIPTISRNCC